MTTNDNSEVMEEGADRYNVPALERGLRVLCEFSRENRTLSAPELARRFDLPRSTVFRLLTTLENMGFLERAEGGRDYRLGLAVLRLGFEYLASLELTQLGTPLLNACATSCARPATWWCATAARSSMSPRSRRPRRSASSVTVGTRLPAHATVLGRVLLEDLTLPQLRALYPEEKLETFSPSTPKTVNELFDMVQADRRAAMCWARASSNRTSPPSPRRCATTAATSWLRWARPSPRATSRRTAWTRWCCACAAPPTRSRAS
jgi:DNA-binding IclR family transcriptional regulator